MSFKTEGLLRDVDGYGTIHRPGRGRVPLVLLA